MRPPVEGPVEGVGDDVEALTLQGAGDRCLGEEGDPFSHSRGDGLRLYVGRSRSMVIHGADRPPRTSASELVRIARAILGDERAHQLDSALADRTAQLARIEQASTTGPRQRRRETSCSGPGRASVRAAEVAQRRIAVHNPELNAFAWLPSEPRLDAAREGTAPLDGFAIAIKDVIDVTDMPTRAGSTITPAGPAASDAPVVARLRTAGAAIVGKTHCTEWALNDPAPTRNPWDTSRTPGGSSAGSAVAVATGMCTATVDTQTAGDVLRPAAYNGVVGAKPSFGWASCEGVWPVAPSIDTIGVTARTVADAADVISAIGDITSEEVHPGAPPRIGVVADPLLEETADAVRTNVTDVVRRLAAAGADVTDIRSPVDLATVHAAHRIITFAECGSIHRAQHQEHAAAYGARARELVELGLATPAHAYIDAQRVREDATEALASMFAGVDVLLLPVTPDVAPRRDTTGDSTFQIPWTLCGYPALSLPSGLTNELPVGVQLVGAPGRDGRLLAAAGWCESALGVDLRSP